MRQFVNFLYLWVAERVKEDDWDRFVQELYRPIPGSDPDRVSDRIAKDEMNDFLEFLGQV